jgi:hypothetical protein
LVLAEINLYEGSSGNPLHAAHAIHRASLTGSSEVILRRIAKARHRADDLLNAISSLSTEDQKEVYLLQRFLVDSLRGARRAIVFQYFFSEFDWKRRKQHWLVPYLSMLGVPLYLLLAALFIFLFGVRIGEGATT